MGKETKYRTFVRFGSLGPVKQKGHTAEQAYNDDHSFHAPPTNYGFYAMPYTLQERFIVGCLPNTQPKLFPVPDPEKFRGADGEIDWDKYNQKELEILNAHYHKFDIKPEEEFWHHLGKHVKRPDILAEYGSWVKTTFKVWVKALQKEIANNRMASTIHATPGDMSSVKKRGFYSKDHYEVFFDKKVA